MAKALGPEEFALERYFNKYEFTVKYMLSSSDAESMPMKELVSYADEECRQLWEDLSLCYTESNGHPLLRQEAAKLHGNHIEEKDVMVVVPQEGIYVAMRALVNHCRRSYADCSPHVVTTFPGYQSLYENLKTMGCRVDHWQPSWKDDCGWTFDLNDLERVLTPESRILVANFPHNPTGYQPSSEQWAKLIQLCKDRNLLLFSDEIYRYSNLDDSPALSSACNVYEDAISMCGMSKSFGLPGLRLGWVCTRNEALMNDMAKFKDYLTICAPGPSEVLSIIGLRNREKVIGRNITLIKANLDRLDVFFKKYEDLFLWERPLAGTIAFIPLKARAIEVFGSATGLATAAREQAQILLLPAKLYDFPDKFFRIGFGRKNLPEVLNEFDKFLQKHLKTT